MRQPRRHKASAGMIPGRGVTVEVVVQPAARRNEVILTASGALKIRVTAPAEHGRANEVARRLLARHLGVAAYQLELLSGFSSRTKRYRLRCGPAPT